MKKNKRIIFATIAALSLAAPMTAVFNFDNVQTVSANHQGTKVWLQYGTLKYALKGPSGRVYPAGTKVVREASDDTKPLISLRGYPFYLTLEIGGIPGNELLQDVGGGRIAEAYVNYEDWQEIDYPSDNVVLVNNTTDYTDLKSSDFHPVDSNNPDVPCANTDKLTAIYNDLDTTVTNSNTKEDYRIRTELTNRYFAATAMGATQESVDKLTQDITNAIAQFKKTGHLAGYDSSGNTNNSGSSNSSNSNSGSTTVTPAKRKSKSRFVKLRKASYQYTHKGKRVSKKKLKKGAIVKINGKTYRIKGKKYYRIAKNRYIRAVNVVKK
ncbi:SLAP domain-containing protein [Lactobacillus helsingborgensis]|uniref:SLAP domain-containing protein n=1 Tax=Lactobacillus helsingborgensis TaxID=1218494 RepID=UPI001CC5F561|nr:SLAP domain-containing protein [Lactobacillus helsingborgensis]